MTAKYDKKELVKKAKGMHDILPREYWVRERLIEKAKTIASFYGFKPIQTPHLEKIELFTSAVGENTDLVEKEMYNLKTKGGDKLVLRPEGTAPIMRAYIEQGMQVKPQPVLLYYYGSFFRHDRPQKGRRREFQQFGIEAIGEANSIADAVVIKVLWAVLEEAAGLKPISLHLNSVGCKECRKIYQKEMTAYYRKRARSLCKDCLRRLKINPLRLLDCKEEKCGELKKEAPQIINYLCEGCTNHFKNLLEILEASGIQYNLDNYLIRGLDYYSRTAFEFFLEGEPLALGGGGRYDGLSAILSGKEIPGVGGALGIDRILAMMPEKQKQSPKKKEAKIFFMQLGTEAKNKSLAVLELLRKAKIPTKHSLSKDSIKSQLKIAAKANAPYALIFGQKEALENIIIVRNTETASQEAVPLEKLADYLKKKL